MKKIVVLGMVCVLFVSLSGCGGSKEEEVVKEDEVKETQKEDKGNDEATFIDSLAIEINGVELKLPMEKEKFLKEAGLEYIKEENGIENVVTDGNSTFEIVLNGTDVAGVNVYADGNTENCDVCNFNGEKTSIIFPIDITIDMSEEEIANQYQTLERGNYKKSLGGQAIWMPTLDRETYGDVSVQFSFDNDDNLTGIYFFKYQ